MGKVVRGIRGRGGQWIVNKARGRQLPFVVQVVTDPTSLLPFSFVDLSLLRDVNQDARTAPIPRLDGFLFCATFRHRKVLPPS